MSLSTEYIHHENIQKAAKEALDNSYKLFLSGYFEAALHLTSQMLTPNSFWQVNTYTNLIEQVFRVHPLYCWANGTDCPQLGNEQKRNFNQLTAWAEDYSEGLLDTLVILDRIQNSVAGENWSQDYIARVERMETENDFCSKDYAQFIHDLDFVLKHRLRIALQRDAPDLLPDFIKQLMPYYFRTDAAIKIASQTEQFDTHNLINILARYVAKFPNGLTYMPERCFLAVMIMDIIAGDTASATVQLTRVLTDENIRNIAMYATWPPLLDLLKTKCLNSHFAIDDEAVEKFLQDFNSRSVRQVQTKIETLPNNKVISLKQFHKLIANTDLAQCELCELDIPECDEKAIAIKVNSKNAIESWKIARQMLNETNRWPVLTCSWSSCDNSLEECLADVFVRSQFQYEDYEGLRLGLSPAALVAGASHVELEDVLRRIGKDRVTTIEDSIEYELDSSDKTPRKEDILAAINSNDPLDAYLELHNYLYDWHQKHNSILANTGHIDWFEPSEHEMMALLLLPTPNSWEAPAYLNWFGADAVGTEVLIALFKKWHEKFGAELVANYGTMLQFYATSKPQTVSDALSIALEQELIAPCTTALPGVSLYEHAAALMVSDKWFLHERP
jgi:hypothetical protein